MVGLPLVGGNDVHAKKGPASVLIGAHVGGGEGEVTTAVCSRLGALEIDVGAEAASGWSARVTMTLLCCAASSIHGPRTASALVPVRQGDR